MNTYTVSGMQRQVLRRAGQLTSAVISAEQSERALDAVNYAYQNLLEIVNDSDSDWFITSADFTLPSGTSTYSTSGIAHIKGVDFWVASGVQPTKFNLPEGNFQHRNAKYPANSLYVPFIYRWFGGNINIIPTPTSSSTFTVWYVPVMPDLVAGGRVTLQVEWAEWMVTKAAVRLLLDEESLEQAALLKAELAELEAKIKQHAVVDQAYPEAPTDMQSLNGFAAGRLTGYDDDLPGNGNGWGGW